MKTPHEVIVKPLVMTEKADLAREMHNQYVFAVALKATKPEIRHAVEELFNVKVRKVRTAVFRGKSVRLGRRDGKRPNWKKAVVTLAEGNQIDFFEGV